MDRGHDRGAHSNHPRDGRVKIRRPGLDRCGQRPTLPAQCDKITADAKQFTTCRQQNSAHIIALAHFWHAEAEFAAEPAIDWIAPVRAVENDMGEAIDDLAFETCCRCRQIHFRLRLLRISLTISTTPCATRHPAGKPEDRISRQSHRRLVARLSPTWRELE